MVMFSVAFSGHINVIMIVGAEIGVMRIQTSGDICVGKLTSDVFLICYEHCEVIPAVLLHIEQQHTMVGLLKVGKVWLRYKIDHLLLSRLETG